MGLFHRRHPTYRIPQGERVYAIGDVHGRLDLLSQMLSRIRADNDERAPLATTLIFLGDLIDRGPQSAQVVALVRSLYAGGNVRVIKGNHEEMLLNAVGGEGAAARALIRNGGLETFTSYGISAAEADRGSFADLASLLTERIPAADLAFLDRGEEIIIIGDYCFVHAGIRPGVPLIDQDGAETRWIRNRFLESKQNHGFMIVHGHTITDQVDVRANRIGLDTGAFASGRLSAIGLEGDQRWFIAATGEADPAWLGEA